jgi:tRNA(Ile)-lysidine synthase
LNQYCQDRPMSFARGTNRENILRKVYHTIEAHRMIREKDRILLAVSGGVDSMVLMDILYRCGRERGIPIAVAHLNHGLRGETALRDARFVHRMASRLGIPFFYAKADVKGYRNHSGLSIEEAGRRLRYRFLSRIAEHHHYTRIATGHHLNDNAEVILMRLLRGSGRQGLSGIPAIRNGLIIRPLLDLSREEICTYELEAGFTHVEDETNSDESFLRNRIRHSLMPLLREHYNPDLPKTLVRSALVCQDEDRLLNAMAEKALEGAIGCNTRTSITLSIDRIKNHSPAIQRRLIRAAVHKVKGDIRGVGFDAVDRILNLMKFERFPNTLHLPGRLWARREWGEIILSLSELPLRVQFPRHPTEKISYEYTVGGIGTVNVPEVNAIFRFEIITSRPLVEAKKLPQDCAFLDMDRLEFPMTIRKLRSTDRFVPLGMEGHQSVRKFLADRKVCIKKRECWPVVLSGDRIVWVAGHRIDNAFRITEMTQNVLSIDLCLPE